MMAMKDRAALKQSFRTGAVPTGSDFADLVDSFARCHSADVRDFGAAGNGSADDTAAIQSAIDSFPPSTYGEVLFPAGAYRIASTLYPRYGIHLRGISRQGTAIDGSGMKGPMLSDDREGASFQHCRISELRFRGNASDPNNHVFHHAGSGMMRFATVERCVVDGCGGDVFHLLADPDKGQGGVYVNRIAHNQIDTTVRGRFVYARGSVNQNVVECNVADYIGSSAIDVAGTATYGLENLFVSRNDFSAIAPDATGRVDTCVVGTNTINIVFEGNYFEGNNGANKAYDNADIRIDAAARGIVTVRENLFASTPYFVYIARAARVWIEHNWFAWAGTRPPAESKRAFIHSDDPRCTPDAADWLAGNYDDTAGVYPFVETS